jgi:hypothetical protein
MKSKSLPSRALRLITYDELRKHVRAFAEGYLKTVLLVGPPGTGKSRYLRQIVGSGAHCIEGNATPFGIYCDVYEHIDQPLVLDDVDGLYKDQNGIRLLKSLCQTDVPKRLSWTSNAAAFDRRGVPRSFTTSSAVAVIANTWETINADVGAFEDRAHVLYFDPTPEEIHREAATWFGDQDVFDFVGNHMHLIAQHSLRVYVLAADLKAAGLDWQQFVLSRFLSGTALSVARFKHNASYTTEEQRAAAFHAAGHGCRSTYFTYAARLRARNTFPRIQLQHPVGPEAGAQSPPRRAPRRAVIYPRNPLGGS